MTVVDIKEIMNLIPHRYPFLLVDKIIEIEEGKSATGIKNVTMNENFFQGHFPENPVMPGVLIIEALAQTAAVLVAKTMKSAPGSKGVLFTTIDKAKFKKQVIPGDVLELKVKIVKSKMSLWVFEAEALVDGKKAAQMSFSAMIYDKS